MTPLTYSLTFSTNSICLQTVLQKMPIQQEQYNTELYIFLQVPEKPVPQQSKSKQPVHNTTRISSNPFFCSSLFLLQSAPFYLATQYNDVIYYYCKNDQTSYRTSDCKRNTIHNPFYKPLQKHKKNHRINSPCNGTFQTKNSFVIKRFIIIIPPYFAKQPIHQYSSHILNKCG